MSANKKVIAIVSLLLCALLVISACTPGIECDWSLVEFDDVVGIHTDMQAQYLAGDYSKISTYAKGNKELSRPNAVRLSWSAQYDDEEVTIAHYVVEIQDSDNQYNTMYLRTAEPYVDVYNLCIGTLYMWRVKAVFSDGRESVSAWSTFWTDDVAPRNLYIDGITNVRDLGGWATPEGRVRQGMIYRCGRLNESGTLQKDGTVQINIEITDEGIDMMRNVLGIKSEIDLRMIRAHDYETGGITSSPLGEDINYYNCELEWNQGNYLTDNLAAVKYFFELASDIDNYPIIFHCNIGTDRTGMFAFLINGLLGVEEEDLYYDYLFSNFGDIENNPRSLSSIQNNYLKTIKSYPGSTLSERIENCLLQLVGVPQWQIDAIKDILSE